MILQSAAQSAEPVLMGAVVIGMGGIVVWAGRTLVDVRDRLQAIHQALFDIPDANPPRGLVAKVNSNEGRIDTLETRVDILSQR